MVIGGDTNDVVPFLFWPHLNVFPVMAQATHCVGILECVVFLVSLEVKSTSTSSRGFINGPEVQSLATAGSVSRIEQVWQTSVIIKSLPSADTRRSSPAKEPTVSA